MKPTWTGWDEVLYVQGEDVSSHSPCLYIGRWDGDSRNWIPEVESTGITWDICSDTVYADFELSIENELAVSIRDFWTKENEEQTIWYPVSYPQ